MQQEKRFSNFLLIWAGQFLSTLGSSISAFALSIWILARTGSATAFSVAFAIGVLPQIVFSPFAGSFADRRNRKAIIIITDTLDALLKLVVILLISMEKLEIWNIYIINFISSSLGVFQGPAFSASLPQIVEKRNLGRANGMNQITMAVRSILAPIVGAALYQLIGLRGVFLLDFISFFFAIATILPVAIPQPALPSDDSESIFTFFSDLKDSWNYLSSRKGMVKLLFMLTLLNAFANIAMVLVGPLVLSNWEPVHYGIVNSCFGVGLIIGSVFSSAFPAKEDKIRKALLSLIPCALALMFMGVSPHYIAIAVGGILFFLTPPYTNATFGTIVQSKIEPEILGRVSALISALVVAVSPIAMLSAGPLSEYVFNPLLREGGALDGTALSRFLGTGLTRGTGLLFIICGILTLISVIILLSDSDIVNFDENNPDVI